MRLLRLLRQVSLLVSSVLWVCKCSVASPSRRSSPSRPASAEPAGRDQEAPGQDAETPTASKVECLEEACLDMNGIENNESNATTSEDEASALVCRKKRRLIASRTAAMVNHSEKGLSFLKLHAVKICGRFHQAL